jgi:tetratricopeptide (TPR) repeat protein
MREGTVIGHRYRIERLAGSGGMGAVYQARDLVRGIDVAIKLDHHAGTGPEARRIAREAETLAERLASLRHPHIVEYVTHGMTAEGAPYLVMEWLEGHDLGARIRHAPLGEDDALELGVRVARALAVIHACGVVHRDVKPGNLFLVDGDLARVKLIDFGLVRVDAALSQLTRSGMLLGTPGFIAPEQIEQSGAVDGRADLYALGAVLFACLTQRPPFIGMHFMAVLGKLALEEAPHVRELRPDVSPELDELIATLLCKQPSGRPDSADELAEEIERLRAQVRGGGEEQTEPSAVSRGEQRFLTVLMAGPLPAESPSAEAPSPDALMSGFGAEAVRLADGTVLAVFAAGNAPDDTAARAARCALAMRQAGILAPMVLATGRGRMDARLPVGEVIDRAVALRFGQARHSAQEASTAAETMPGMLLQGIAVDDVTAGLIDGRFQLDEEPGRGYRLRAESSEPRAVRGLGADCPCVGRDREIGAIESLFDECVDESSPRAMLVIGQAGAGKSRLAHELIQRLERHSVDAPTVWRAYGDPMREGSSLGLLGRLLAHAAGVAPESAQAERRVALARRVRMALGPGGAAQAERITVFLSEIAAAPYPDEAELQLREARRDPRLMHDQMRRAWEDWLDAEAAIAPILLLLDDLQWADLPSVRFVEAALRNLGHRPIFVLALARPEIDEVFPDLWAARQPDRMALRPLSKRACTELAQQHPEALAPELVERLVERAGGNPFYLEELLRHARTSDEALPDTVLALVGVRLAALPAEERRALRAASVFGRSFWADGVAALLGDDSAGASTTRGLVDRLIARDLVQPDRQARLAGADAYRFGHELVREAAYAMLPFEDCVRAHRQAGAWLERAGEGDAHVLAEHYRRGQAPAQALPWFQRAAEQALEADDVQAVVECVEHAIACGAAGETLGALRLLEAEAQNWSSQHQAAYRAAGEALSRLPRGSDAWAQAAHQRSWAAAVGGNDEVVVHVAGELLACATEPLSDACAIAMAHCATHLLSNGRRAEVHGLVAVLDARPPAQAPSVAGSILHMHAMEAGYSGQPHLAATWFMRAIEQWDAAGNARQACLDRCNLGNCLRALGQYEDSITILRRALEQSQRLDVEHLVSSSSRELALGLARLGQMDEAQSLVHDTPRYAQSERAFRSVNRAWLALGAGRPADALAELERGVILADDMPTSDVRALALAVRASALLALGQPYDAVIAAQAGMDILTTTGAIEDGEAFLRLTHVETLHATAAHEQARAAIAAAHAWLLAQAAQIDDPAWRQSFLDRVAEHRRIAELAREWSAEATHEHG